MIIICYGCFQDQNAGKLFADEAAAMYERAISSTLKSNRLIYFAYAEFEEVRMKKNTDLYIYISYPASENCLATCN